MTGGYKVRDDIDEERSGTVTEWIGFFNIESIKCGTITPANIGSFRIINLGTEATEEFEYGMSNGTSYYDVIRTSHKCILHINGKDYNVTNWSSSGFWHADSYSNGNIPIPDKHTVKVTCTLL